MQSGWRRSMRVCSITSACNFDIYTSTCHWLWPWTHSITIKVQYMHFLDCNTLSMRSFFDSLLITRPANCTMSSIEILSSCMTYVYTLWMMCWLHQPGLKQNFRFLYRWNSQCFPYGYFHQKNDLLYTGQWRVVDMWLLACLSDLSFQFQALCIAPLQQRATKMSDWTKSTA